MSAPSSRPACTSSWIFSSCMRELIAPTSVFLSSGSPTRSVVMRCLSFSISGSAIDSWTNRRELPRQHQQREIPRDDLPGDAERPRNAIRECVLELVGPTGVVEEVRRRERQVDIARLLDRLAAVQRLEHRKLARALLQDPRD